MAGSGNGFEMPPGQRPTGLCHVGSDILAAMPPEKHGSLVVVRLDRQTPPGPRAFATGAGDAGEGRIDLKDGCRRRRSAKIDP